MLWDKLDIAGYLRGEFYTFAGCDEVGRGPIAGPLVAACVSFARAPWIDGLEDSKKIATSTKREKVLEAICQQAKEIKLCVVDVSLLEKEDNIHLSSLRAMQICAEDLSLVPQRLFVDGKFPLVSYKGRQTAVVGGDDKLACVGAASIVAKVFRDRQMEFLHQQYPAYNWKKNRGYATKEHLEALKKFGPSPYHRKNFQPVRDLLDR